MDHEYNKMRLASAEIDARQNFLNREVGSAGSVLRFQEVWVVLE